MESNLMGLLRCARNDRLLNVYLFESFTIESAKKTMERSTEKAIRIADMGLCILRGTV